jgi:hypothetical protein
MIVSRFTCDFFSVWQYDLMARVVRPLFRSVGIPSLPSLLSTTTTIEQDASSRDDSHCSKIFKTGWIVSRPCLSQKRPFVRGMQCSLTHLLNRPFVLVYPHAYACMSPYTYVHPHMYVLTNAHIHSCVHAHVHDKGLLHILAYACISTLSRSHTATRPTTHRIYVHPSECTLTKCCRVLFFCGLSLPLFPSLCCRSVVELNSQTLLVRDVHGAKPQCWKPTTHVAWQKMTSSSNRLPSWNNRTRASDRSRRLWVVWEGSQVPFRRRPSYTRLSLKIWTMMWSSMFSCCIFFAVVCVLSCVV